MNVLGMPRMTNLPVRKDEWAPKVSSEGVPILAIIYTDPHDPLKNCVLVHPDNWDEFHRRIDSLNKTTARARGMKLL